MAGPRTSGLLRSQNKEADDWLEAVYMDSSTADAITIPAVGATVTVTNVNNGEAWDVGSIWAFVALADGDANFEIRITSTSGTSVTGTCLRKEGSGSYTGWACTRTAPPSASVYASYSATVTPTAGTPNVSAVDTTNELATITAHGLTTGMQIIPIGTVIGGLTVGRAYFVNAYSANQISFHLTYDAALAGTSKINLTSNTAMTWRKLVYSNVKSYNMSAVCAVGYMPNQAAIGLHFFLANSDILTGAAGIVYMRGEHLKETAGGTYTGVVGLDPTTKSGYLVGWDSATYMTLTIGAGTTLDNITTQGVNYWTVQFWLI